MQSYAWLLLAFPLAGFAITGGAGRRLGRGGSAAVGCAAVIAAFVVSLVAFFQVNGEAVGARYHDLVYYRWIDAGTFHLNIGILIDPLTCVMLLVVTGVGSLIHIYSAGYMEHDRNFSRFFAYLNLFIFSMLVLVLADNFITLLVGWGLVGLSSYLLIGFWFYRPAAVRAARKAFVMNVIGDFGVMIACYIMFVQFGTLAFDKLGNNGLPGVFDGAQRLSSNTGVVNWICITLLIGAVAKSAQLPLYTWLPDAMEGPTPVSALIHAATMVTAGVYLLARCHVLYLQAPTTLAAVAIIGGAGALFAATMALVQTDIKRVLAYSTMSQIAYMFLACGVGAFTAGVFHLVTHAFFKAALFLGAGNIIHALHDEQDMRKMGGLRRKLPVTYVAMGIGCLAISGIPPFSGFMSKDEILGRVFDAGGGNIVLWILGVVTAGLTAFYMFRLFFMTFHGRYGGDRDVLDHAHEAPSIMTLPVVILAALATVAGVLQIPNLGSIFNGTHVFEDFLAPVFARYPLVHAVEAPLNTNVGALALILVLAVAGIVVAYQWYAGPVRKPFAGLKPVYNLLFHKYYVDEAYDELIVIPVRNGASALYNVIDRRGIDAFVDGAGRLVRTVSAAVSPLESGFVRTYALTIFAGVVLVATGPVLGQFGPSALHSVGDGIGSLASNIYHVFIK